MKLKNLLYVACACVASYSFARYVELNTPTNPFSEEERNRKMAEFAAVRQSLNTAIDDLTNALADEVQRITSAIANKNSHTNQIELDPEISKLKNLTQKLRDFDVDSLLTDNSDLQSAVSETPDSPAQSPSSQPQANQPVNPVNQPSTAQIGVSDSDNPSDPLSSPPLGSPATILQGSGAPTDAVVEGNSAVNTANANTDANADDPALAEATPENTAPRGD